MSLNNISPSTFTSVLISENIDSTTKTGGGAIVSAALEIQSADAGLLISRVTTEERMSMIVVNGFIVYDSTLNDFYFYSNGSWYGLSSNDAPSDATYVLKSVDANLPNAQSLGALTSGVIYNTVNAGVGTLSTCTNIIDSATTHTLFVGYGAGNTSSPGGNNLGIGYHSLLAATTGSVTTSVGLGVSTLAALTTGTGNVAFGDQAGSSKTSLSNCMFLGSNSDASANALTNATAIGHGATVAISNAIILGNNCYVGIGTSSPEEPLHVVGAVQQKGYTGSGWNHIDIVTGQVVVTTANSTPTILGAFPGSYFGPGPDLIYISVDLIGTTATGDGQVYATDGTTAIFSYISGVATIVNGASGITLVGTGTLAATVSAAWSVSGGELRLTVTDSAGENVNWVASWKGFLAPGSTA